MTNYIRVKPLTYYKFRCSKPELEIRGLTDKIGSDFRSSEVPYNVTSSPVHSFLKEVIEGKLKMGFSEFLFEFKQLKG